MTPGFLQPGFGFKIPLIQVVQQYPVGTQVLTMIAKTSEGRVQEARSSLSQAEVELETKLELERRGAGLVAKRDIEKGQKRNTKKYRLPGGGAPKSLYVIVPARLEMTGADDDKHTGT